MNTIKFNDTEFQVENYSKNTYLSDGHISSNANCSVIVSDITVLNALMLDTITSIQIKYNDDVIYDLHDISAHIDNISEYLNVDRMNISVNLTFDNE